MCEFDGDINSGSDSTLDTVDESSTDFGSDDTGDDFVEDSVDDSADTDSDDSGNWSEDTENGGNEAYDIEDSTSDEDAEGRDNVPSELDTTGESGFDTPQNEYPAGGLWGPDPDYYGDGSYEGMWNEDTSAEEANERARKELDEFNCQQQEDAAEEEEEQERMQEEEAEEQERMQEEEEDLAERQIKLSELAYGTEKAKMLFRDMMQQASFDFGFETDDLPLMIEATSAYTVSTCPLSNSTR